MSAAPTSAAPPPPDGPAWIAETLALARLEARSFLGTALGIMRRPGRFSADWVAGRRAALNPLGFVASALAISGAFGLLLPAHSDGSLVTTLALAVTPYLYYAGVGILCQPLLRLAGSRRGASASIAVALFAGGGPGLVAVLAYYLVLMLRIGLFPHFEGSIINGIPQWAKPLFYLLCYAPSIYYVSTLALALAGLHAVGRLRALAAVLVSLSLFALLFGFLHQRGFYDVGTPHFVIMMINHHPQLDIWF